MSIGAHFGDRKRIPGAHAGYMELPGAKKDGDCEKVEVANGISRERGCCNEFKPATLKTIAFKCGTCKHVTGK